MPGKGETERSNGRARKKKNAKKGAEGRLGKRYLGIGEENEAEKCGTNRLPLKDEGTGEETKEGGRGPARRNCCQRTANGSRTNRVYRGKENLRWL